MAGSDTLGFRFFQVGINRPQGITKLSGMGIANRPHFIDNFVIEHFLLQEALLVCK